MFRAIKSYDGSGTEKCISLTPGDGLSAVHALDETWFIGFNERSGEIGAFPIKCVEAVGNEYGPMPGEDDKGHKMDEKAIYANVSKQIQSRKAAEANSGGDLGPVERSRSLSAQAKTFDVNKFRGTKPEKTFRLTLVKKGSGDVEQEDDTVTDPNDPRRPSLVRPEAVFSLDTETTTDLAPDNKDGEPKVRFSEVTLQHSISADSSGSWQESFSMSYENPQYATPGDVLGKDKTSPNKPEDGKYHKMKRGSLQRDAENESICSTCNILKIVFAVLSSLIVLGLLFVVLVFSFGYTVVESGIVVGISALIIGLGVAFSPLCRCTMSLLLPNLISGKGRAVYLIVLLGILLSYPVLNIGHNLRETTGSLACLTELAENQTRAVQGQLSQPYRDIATYIDGQTRQLTAVAGELYGALGKVDAHLNNFYGNLDQIDAYLVEVVKQCKKPFIDAVNRCADKCTSVPAIEAQCLQACSFMYGVSTECDAIKDARKASDMNDASVKARAAIESVNDYFNVDLQTFEEATVNTNTSIPANSTYVDITNIFVQKCNDFELFINIIQKVLSFAVCLLFLQSFWYLRNYISKDDFDNIYITQELVELAKQSATNGSDPVLPLKEREKYEYVDTKSCCPIIFNTTNMKSGLTQIVLHCLVCVFVSLFDFALFDVLTTVRDFGAEGQRANNGITYRLNVSGSSHIAEFYRVLLQGVNLKDSFTINLNVAVCLPEPTAPSCAVTIAMALLYCLLITLLLLRGYGMRLRRKLAAFYYPEYETSRVQYLYENIVTQRKTYANTLDQKIRSTHKEVMALKKLRLSKRFVQLLSYMERFVPALARCTPRLERLRCLGCRRRARHCAEGLRKCAGEGRGGALCEAVYCEECRQELGDRCPVCEGGLQ